MFIAQLVQKFQSELLSSNWSKNQICEKLNYPKLTFPPKNVFTSKFGISKFSKDESYEILFISLHCLEGGIWKKVKFVKNWIIQNWLFRRKTFFLQNLAFRNFLKTNLMKFCSFRCIVQREAFRKKSNIPDYGDW